MLSPNTILQNRYRVVRELGHGGMGTVYEAIDQRVNCLVALKETLTNSNSVARAAFEREAALLANLRHQSLPKVMDFFSEDESDFLVMEFIPGNDLAQLLKLRGYAFPQEEVLGWGFDLLRLLRYLHEQAPPVLHRDIKPANLKVTNQGEIFLLDFGLAKGSVGQMPTMQTSRSVHGYTPIYASLEQIHGQGTDARSDLYSLGATLYHLLAGVPPIAATTRYNAIADDKPDPLPSIQSLNSQASRNVAQVIELAMAIVRKQRFTSADAMSKALQNAAEVDSPGPAQVYSQSRTTQLDPSGVDTEAKGREETAKQIVTREPAGEKSSATSSETHPVAGIESVSGSALSTADGDVIKPVARRRRVLTFALVTTAIVLFVAMLVIAPTAVDYIKRTSSNTNTSQVSPPSAPANSQGFEFLTLTLDKYGNVLTRTTKTAQSYMEKLGNDVQLEMVAIPPGEFMMGGPEGESIYNIPQHRVRIEYSLYMGKFEVTQLQWRTIMGTNPSNFVNCNECPVELVSWDDAQEFCRRLSLRTGMKYRLPTESEWEYAARAGTTTTFAFGETINPDLVNYKGDFPWANGVKGLDRAKTIAVGSLYVANGFGLYDMHGNVWEWCEDLYHDSYKINGVDAPTDGSAWLTGGEQKFRVVRGGAWNYGASSSRSAERKKALSTDHYPSGGFRVAVVR